MTLTPKLPKVPGKLWKAMILFKPEIDPAIIADAIAGLPGFLAVGIVPDAPRPEVIEITKGLPMALNPRTKTEDYDG